MHRKVTGHKSAHQGKERKKKGGGLRWQRLP